MARTWRAAFSAGLFLAGNALCPPAAAQLANGGFATGLGGWQIQNSPGFSASWVAEDAQGAPASGSAQIGNANPGTNAAAGVLTQCLPVNPLEPVPYGASARVLDEGEADVQAWLVVMQFANALCSGEAAAIESLTVNPGTPDWQSASSTWHPAGPHIQSVRVALSIRKAIGTGIGGLVRWDDAFFGEAAIALRRWTIDAGGGSAGGGGFELRGSTVGQPDAGSASAGGFDLQAGFWSGRPTAPGDRIFANGFESP